MADESTSAQGSHRHDAFISYRSGSSQRQARYLQKELERIARRSVGDSAIRLFRDETNLRFEPLWDTLRRELDGSRRLIVLLHKGTQDSPWVDREITYWLEHGGSADRLILVRTDPDLDLAWDTASVRFVHQEELPSSLVGVFSAEPLWFDLSDSSLGKLRSDPDALARLCATLLDRDPVEVLQREIKEQKRRQQRLRAVLVGVTCLAILAVSASILAVMNRNEAERQRVEAEAQAQAAQTLLLSGQQPERAIEAAVGAANNSASGTVQTALLSVINDNAGLRRLLPMAQHLDGQPPDDLVMNSQGTRLLEWREATDGTQFAMWDLVQGREVGGGIIDDLDVTAAEIAGDESFAYCASRGGALAQIRSESIERTQTVEGSNCMIGRMFNGLVMLAEPEDSEAVLMAVDSFGKATSVDGIDFLAMHPSGDLVLVRHGGDYVALSPDGSELALPALNGISPQRILTVDAWGEVFARASDGRWWLGNIHSPEMGRFLPAPASAPAAAKLEGAHPGALWLTNEGDFRWSLDDRRVKLFSGDEMASFESQVWTDSTGSIAVAHIGSTAKVVHLRTGNGVREMRDGREITGIVDADTVLGRLSGDVLLLDRGDEGFAHVDSSGVELLEGRVLADAASGSALVMNREGTQIMSLAPGVSEPIQLDDSGNVQAAAFTSDGEWLAVSRPSAPVAIYSMRDRALSNPLVAEDSQGSQTKFAALGNLTLANVHGNVTRTDSSGDAEVVYTDEAHTTAQVTQVSPDGKTVVLDVYSRPGGSTEAPETTVKVVTPDGQSQPLHESCPDAGDLIAFQPGPNFKESLDDAEAQHLVFRQAEEEDGGTMEERAYECLGGQVVDVPDLPGNQILDYQMSDEEGRIIAMEGENVITVTSWSRGDQDSLATSEFPSSGVSTKVAMDDSTQYAAVWGPASSSVSIQQRSGDGWQSALQLTPPITDIAAVRILSGNNMLLVGSKAGEILIYELNSGRLILRHLMQDLVGEATGFDARVFGDELRINLRTREDAEAAGGTAQATIPVGVSLLKSRLCQIAPGTRGC